MGNNAERGMKFQTTVHAEPSPESRPAPCERRRSPNLRTDQREASQSAAQVAAVTRKTQWSTSAVLCDLNITRPV